MPPRSILGRCRPARELTSCGAVRIRANGAAAMRPSRLRPCPARASAVLGQERRAMIPQYSDPNNRADQGRRNKPIQRAARRSAIHGYRAATAAAISLIERDLAGWPADHRRRGRPDNDRGRAPARHRDRWPRPAAGLPLTHRAGQRCGADAPLPDLPALTPEPVSSTRNGRSGSREHGGSLLR